MTAPAPRIRTLDLRECEELLAAHHVGRLAFSYRDKVDIEPIHYVYSEGWIYGRTGEGTKLRTLAHNRWVAFEIDEVDGLFDWRSVVVKGALYLLAPSADETWTYAVSLLQRVVPGALSSRGGRGRPLRRHRRRAPRARRRRTPSR